VKRQLIRREQEETEQTGAGLEFSTEQEYLNETISAQKHSRFLCQTVPKGTW